MILRDGAFGQQPGFKGHASQSRLRVSASLQVLISGLRWTKSADDILASIDALLPPHPGRSRSGWIGTPESGH